MVGAAGVGTTIWLVLDVAAGEGGLVRPAVVLIGVGLVPLVESSSIVPFSVDHTRSSSSQTSAPSRGLS